CLADSAMAPALFVTIDMLQSARSTKQQYEGYRKHDNYNIDSAFTLRSGRSVLLHAAGNERSSRPRSGRRTEIQADVHSCGYCKRSHGFPEAGIQIPDR